MFELDRRGFLKMTTLGAAGLAAAMKHARIWGHSSFDGQVVHAEHVLADGDVVEIHA